jgi:hypothetical protein
VPGEALPHSSLSSIHAKNVVDPSIHIVFTLVLTGWEKKVFEPLSQAFFSAKNPKTRHVMLPSTRVLELKKSSVIVDRENISAGFSTEIFFDVRSRSIPYFLSFCASARAGCWIGCVLLAQACVLAMGSTYRFPMRPSSTNQDEMVAALKQSQARIASASSILVVGGGATGVEYSGVCIDLPFPLPPHPLPLHLAFSRGTERLRWLFPSTLFFFFSLAQEIASHFPKAKTVTLVQSGPTLLASKYPPKLAKKLKAGLEQLGVRIVLNERVGQDLIEAGKGSFTTKSGETIRGTSPALVSLYPLF